MFIAVHIKAHFGVQHNVLGSNHLHQAQMWPQWTPYLSSAMSGLWCLTAASVRQQSQERAWKLLAAPYLTCPRSAKFLCPLEVHWCFCRAATFPAIVKAQPKIGYMLVWTSHWELWNKKVFKHMHHADVISLEIQWLGPWPCRNTQLKEDSGQKKE